MDKVEIYQDTAGEWRWRRIAPNGEIISAPGDGFRDTTDAKRAASRANLDIRPEEIVTVA